MVLFGVFVRYDSDADPHWLDTKEQENSTSDMENEFYYRYPSKSGHPAGPPEAFPAGPPPPGREPSLAAPAQPAAREQGAGGGRGLEEEKLLTAPWPSLPGHPPVAGEHA